MWKLLFFFLSLSNGDKKKTRLSLQKKVSISPLGKAAGTISICFVYPELQLQKLSTFCMRAKTNHEYFMCCLRLLASSLETIKVQA